MNLSSEQRRAVESAAPHKRVIAGAGSGKTRLLVAQVGRWIHDGIDPARMVAITYTRRAGEELRQRLWDTHGVSLGYVGTVHGMAYLAMSLCDDGRLRLTPLSAVESNGLTEHVASEVRLKSALTEKVYKTVRGERVNPASLSSIELALVHAVWSQMGRWRLVPVGTLVDRFAAAMLADTRLREWMAARACAIVWDEYQDSTEDEASLLGTINPGLSVVVGDPRQAIFGFRHASSDHLWARDVQTFDLRLNYRSTRRVIEVANRAASERLVAFREDAGDALGFPCEPDMAPWLSAEVAARWATQGSTAVLCRTNREVEFVCRQLAAEGVDALALSPKFDKYAGEMWGRLYVACRYAMDPDCPWLQGVASANGVLPDARRTGEVEDLSARELLAPWWRHQVPDDPALELSVLRFVSWYQRRDLDDFVPDVRSKVLVMTAHASKGQEFDDVVLCDVGRKLGGRNEEEERNLLYVGITRARNRLALVGHPLAVTRLVMEDQ